MFSQNHLGKTEHFDAVIIGLSLLKQELFQNQNFNMWFLNQIHLYTDMNLRTFNNEKNLLLLLTWKEVQVVQPLLGSEFWLLSAAFIK